MTTADNESELLSRAKAGDASAFERALRPHLAMLLAYSRAICGDYHIAQDVVQETSLIAFRNLNHLFEEVDFAVWLRAIARREALYARRKAARLTPMVEEALEGAYNDPEPDAGLLESAALAECLKTLDGRTGNLVRAHYFNGSKLADLAAAMGLNLNTVKSLLHRARSALQKCVQKRVKPAAV